MLQGKARGREQKGVIVSMLSAPYAHMHPSGTGQEGTQRAKGSGARRIVGLAAYATLLQGRDIHASL